MSTKIDTFNNLINESRRSAESKLNRNRAGKMLQAVASTLIASIERSSAPGFSLLRMQRSSVVSRDWNGLVKIGRKRAGYTAVTHASWVV